MTNQRITASIGAGLLVAGLCIVALTASAAGAEALYKATASIGLPWMTPLLMSTVVPGVGAGLLAWAIPSIYRQCDPARRASPQP